MINENHTMSQVIFHHPRILLVLERFSIKLGFDEQTIDMVCNEYAIHKTLFLAIANLFCCKERVTVNIQEFSAADAAKILMFLRNSHRFFLDEKIPKLKELIRLKIADSSREKYSLSIKKFIDDYAAEVFEHMNYEEDIVFPYVTNLLERKQVDGSYSMQQFKKHHTDIETKLTDLKNLLVQYVPPEYDSVIRRKILFELFELEHDINIHDHIENHLLIPIVEKMESEPR